MNTSIITVRIEGQYLAEIRDELLDLLAKYTDEDGTLADYLTEFWISYGGSTT